jgi:2,5-diketo-D-gluconate reductase B
MPELKIPPIGFGTWMLTPEECKDAVMKAIEIGFRHIDTAQLYGNEAEVGEAIADCGVPRDDLVIATKVWSDQLRHDDVIKSTEISLKKLKLDRVDILYIHWPADTYNPSETLAAFSELVDAGKVDFIGVSNFTPALIDVARETCDKPILVCQVEHHPFLQQKELRSYLQEKNMQLVAYSPLARRRVLNSPELQDIAAKHDATPGQVSLAWIMAHGAVPIPKATSEEHIKENFDAQALVLDIADIEAIDAISTTKRIINPPGLAPQW